LSSLQWPNRIKNDTGRSPLGLATSEVCGLVGLKDRAVAMGWGRVEANAAAKKRGSGREADLVAAGGGRARSSRIPQPFIDYCALEKSSIHSSEQHLFIMPPHFLAPNPARVRTSPRSRFCKCCYRHAPDGIRSRPVLTRVALHWKWSRIMSGFQVLKIHQPVTRGLCVAT
jgi:hypothetical protein